MLEKVLPHVLSWLSNVANMPNRSNIVAWHESSSQHWRSNSGSGYFDVQRVDSQETEYLYKNPHLIPTHSMQVTKTLEV